MRRGWVAVLLGLALSLATRLAWAGTVSNPDPPFAISVPDGFQRRDDLNRSVQILTFQRAGLTGSRIGTIIAVDRLGGTIGREPLTADQLASAGVKGATVEQVTWRTFDVSMARQTADIGGRAGTMFFVQIPLKPEAIQVKVITDASEEAEGRALMLSTIATIQGDTNWLTTDERSKKLGEGIARLVIAGLVFVVIAGAVIAFVVRRRRSAAAVSEPPGAYDGISVAPPPVGMASGAPPSGPITKTKCPQCGLVSFASGACRRCGNVA